MDFTDAFTNAVEAKQVAEQKKKQAEINAFNNEIITNSVDYDVDPLIEKRINDFVNKQNKYTIPSLLQDETNDTTFKKRKIIIS